MTMKLPRCLKIKDDELLTCLAAIRDRVKKFWDPPLLQYYTKHGLDHSLRIIEILGMLLKDYSTLLNKYERFILVASIYLHDIGMQSPKHAGLPSKPEYTVEDLELIRKNHHEVSAKIIRESVSPKHDVSLGLEGCKDLVDFIATVVRYHRKLSISELIEKTSFASEPIRLRLLAALLRLSDELDFDFRRVNMEILKLREIPVESKYYWFTHHYISSVPIERGKIKLYFRFPKEYEENEIVDEFCNKVHESIKNQLYEVYDLLFVEGIKLHYEAVIEQVRYLPEGQLELIPDDLLEYINNVIETKKSSQERSIETGVVWFVDGIPYSDNAQIVNSLNNLFKFTNEGRYLDALKEVEKCNIYTMAPMDRMIFSGIAGNCYFFLSRLNEAENYYNTALKLSFRKDLEKVYQNDVILTRATNMGNLGLIFKSKGDLDIALKYCEEALAINQKIEHKYGEANNLSNIGNIYSNKGDLEKALNYLEEALRINKEIGYKPGEALDLGSIGLIYSDKGDLEKALNYLEEALRVNKEIGYKPGEAFSLNSIGQFYSDKGDLEKALNYLEEALRINKEIGYKSGEASDLGSIGLIYSDQGDLEKALKTLEEALNINKESGYKRGEATSLGNIGIIYKTKGNLDIAHKYLEEALTINKQIGHKKGEATGLSNIGLIYKDKGELDAALTYFKEALKIDRKIGYKQGEATNLGHIGLIYFDKGDLEKALKTLEEELNIDKESGYKLGEATSLGNIGLIYKEKGELDTALTYFKDALKIDREIGYKQGEATDLGNIGLIYKKKGKSDMALEKFEETLKIYLEIGYKMGEANCLGNIGMIHFDKGDLEMALTYFEDALKIDREIGYKQGEATDLGNIGIYFYGKGDLSTALKYLQEALKIFEEFKLVTGKNNIIYAIEKIRKEIK